MEKVVENAVDPDVLVLLKTLQPGRLYQMTSKSVFLSGFEDYKAERLQSLLWQNNQNLLKARLAGPAVTLSVRGKNLHFACNCPSWRAEKQCRHVICVLLTLLNLITPKWFHRPNQDENRLQSLKAVLFRNQAVLNHKIAASRTSDSQNAVSSRALSQEKEAAVEVVIESKGEYPAVFLRKGGRVVDALTALPEGLSIFTYRYHSDQSLRDRFFKHLKRFENTYLLVFEGRSGPVRLNWDPALIYQSKTELNISGPYVEVRACVFFEGKRCEMVERFWDFVVNPETHTLGRVQDRAGWGLFDHLDRLFRVSALTPFERLDEIEARRLSGREWIVPNAQFKIPLKTFQSIQLNITQKTLNHALNHLILKVAGNPVSVQRAKHEHRLTIDSRHGEQTCLRAECRVGDSAGVTTAHAFGFFTDLHTQGLPNALKAIKRLTVLYQTFFRLFEIKKPTEALKIIRKALSNGDFADAAVRRAARDFLKRAFEHLKGKDVRLHFSAGHWYVAPNEKEKEMRLYKIPFACFGPKIFREMTRYHEIPLPTKQLESQLSYLHAQCQAVGITLYYQGKPVQTVKWDFAFDARRRSGIDWFELRPEIRSDGVKVSEAVWQKLLQRRGIVEAEDAVQIVDANAKKIIDALALLYPASKNLPREKREIVQVPRLQLLDWVMLRKEGVHIRLSEADEELIKHLTQLEKIEPIALPQHLNAILRPYQKEGLDWLAFLYRHRFGAILADDMGLGKTLQAIALLAALKEKCIPAQPESKAAPHLIVVPPTLLFNWEKELSRFYPDLKPYPYFGKDRRLQFKAYDIVLTTYAIVRRDIGKLKDIPFHVIIFDEAQTVKNIYAETTGAVRQLKSTFNLVMTGTPVENHLGEYYSLIDLCLPGLLGEYDRFKSQLKLENAPMLEVLVRRTRPFVLRRIKENVLADLPPKIESDLYLSLTAEQKTLYQQTVALISSRINHAYRDKTSGQAKIIALTAIMKLRQLCVSPRLIGLDFKAKSGHSPKIAFLVEQLQALQEERHSALVFSQFTRALDLLEEALTAVKLPYSRLDGSTPTRKRKALVKAFQENTSPSVFLLSLKAGGQGLNLTKASYVFHLDPWWNPAVENQASDRVHRIGQQRNVSITRILMRHTIEEKMMDLKKKKSALYEAVMGGDVQKGEAYALSKSDFDFLLEA